MLLLSIVNVHQNLQRYFLVAKKLWQKRGSEFKHCWACLAALLKSSLVEKEFKYFGSGSFN